ncbi:hypothetical protein IL992_23485 [Microbispora sp. NEAU-D428]|uniref:PKD domain-containing protein n=1 Tax=Microbispora sitophila TaxID=2771537 RepID=UPI001868E719|nr:PKD domain-containing protein [Microbispora sitophila]MBE3012137.1 hypothetical protein [Microbispora sitophila]
MILLPRRDSARRIATPLIAVVVGLTIAVVGSLAIPLPALAASASVLSRDVKVAAAEPAVKIIDLGPVDDDDDAISEGDVTAINNKGEVVGFRSGGTAGIDEEHAVLFSGGTVTDIHALVGAGSDNSSVAQDINDDGTVVVTTDNTSTDDDAPAGMTYLVKNGTVSPIGKLAGAYGINDRGQVVGSAFVRDADGSKLSLRSFKNQYLEARAINNSGQVVGFADMDSDPPWDFQAYRTEPGEPLDPRRDILTVPIADGFFATIATAINEQGWVAGYVDRRSTPEVALPVIWDDYGKPIMQTIPSRGGRVKGINKAGIAVGELIDSWGRERAALYQGGEGIDLNTLLPPGSGWTLRSAKDINDLNEIAGVGRLGGSNVNHAFLLDLGTQPVINSVTLETKRYPSTEWTSAADGGSTVEGNKVRVTVQVTNPSNFPVSADLRLVDEVTGRSIVSGAQILDLHPHQTFTAYEIWDTTGWAWEKGAKPQSDRKVAAKLYYGDRVVDSKSQPVVVVPKPVVAVHGFRSDAEDTWGEFDEMMQELGHPQGHVWAVGDGQVEGRMDTGEKWNPLHETYRMWENVDELATYIEDVRKKTGAFYVNVVAHSMGGLITRQYIQTKMPMTPDNKPVVTRLIGMGVPNAGSPCADMLVEKSISDELSPWYPAVIDNTTERMNGDEEHTGFNAWITNLKGVLASNLVGDLLPVPCTTAKDPLPSVGDTVVPTWSALHLLPGWGDHHITYTPHSFMTFSEADFTEYVLPRLATLKVLDTGLPGPTLTSKQSTAAPGKKVTAPAGAAATTATTGDGAGQDGSLSMFDGPTVTVEAGQTASVPLQVPQGLAFGVTGVLPETVGLSLRDPSGKVATSYAAGSEAAKQLFQGLSVTNPQAGGWTLEVTNTAAQAVKADLTAWVTGNPVKVVAKAQAAEDGRVTVTAAVTDDGQPVTGVPVTARMVGAEHNPAHIALTLNDDGNSGDGTAGDGVYGARTDVLPDDQYYVVAKADTAKGLRTDREVVEVAKPDLREFALELSAGKGGSVSASPAQDTYRVGTKVKVTATADAGRVPIGWVVDGQERGPGALTLTMDQAHTVEARFGTYTVTELGALPGGDASHTSAGGLNDSGQVAATATGKDGRSRAVRWQDGVLTDLGGLACTDAPDAGKCEAGATDINEAGQVSGWATTSVNGRNDRHAVVYGGDGSVTDLQPQGTTTGMALGLNDNGQVFGQNGAQLAVWERGQAGGLPASPEFFTHSPSARGQTSHINAGGAVAGATVTHYAGTEPISWSPAVYRHGVITPFSHPGCVNGVAHDISNAGVAAGEMSCGDGQGQHAFTWKDGEWTDLGAGKATALNGYGVVAGQAPGPKGDGDWVPALWVDGKQYKLADVLPRPLCPTRAQDTTEPCIRLISLSDVNSSGQILAQGVVRDRSQTVNGFPDSMRSFLLTPTTAKADLEVSASVSAAEPGPTSSVTWTATVVNKGADAATDVRLDVLVPDALAGTAACETFRGICAPIKGGFRNTVKVLQPGWSAKVEISATIPADMADGTELKVQAEGYSLAVADPQPDNDAAVATATVRPLLSTPGVVWWDPVKVGTSSDPVTVTLTNRLNSPIPLKGIDVEGPFAQSNSCPVELPVGDKCVVTLTFAPTAEGAASGKLAFTTADGAAPAYTVTLAGTGAANVNAKPVVQVPATPLRGTVGKPFTLSVDFTDADTSDQHSAQVAWGDGPPVTATVDQKPGGGTVTATKTFTGPISGMAVVMVSDGKETTWQGIPYVIEDAAPNTAPVVTAGPDVEVTVGEKLQRGVVFTDADSTSWTATVDYGDGSGAQPVTPSADKRIGLEHQWVSAGTYTVTVKVKDDGGLEATGKFAVTVKTAETPNQAPKVTLLGYDTPTEAGSEWVGRGSFTDPDSSSWTYTADYGDGAGPQPLTLTAGQLKLSHVYDTAGDYTVVLTVTDDKGGTGSAQLVAHVTNPAPEATLKAAPATVAVGEQVMLAGSFTDKATGDTHTATWAIGGKQVTGAVAERNGKGTLTLPYTFTKPGLYTVAVTVADNHGARTTADTAAGKKVQVLVFDQDASLTGAGKLTVPAGACKVNAECAKQDGTVSFTVSAHYPGKGKGRTPTGKVSYTAPGFELRDGSLSVLSAADGTAIARGTGQVKGAGKVSFEITATDTGAGKTDRFHLVVWDAKGTLVYDNQPAGAPAPVSGVLRVAG